MFTGIHAATNQNPLYPWKGNWANEGFIKTDKEMDKVIEDEFWSGPKSLKDTDHTTGYWATEGEVVFPAELEDKTPKYVILTDDVVWKTDTEAQKYYNSKSNYNDTRSEE